MRLLTLALLGLALCVDPAQAANRSGPSGGGVAPAKAAPAAKRALKAPVPKSVGRAQASYRNAAHQTAACGRGGARCRGAGVVRARFGWSQGLSPAAGVQANECPDGTMATLARGHDDVVRCMPI